MSYQWIGLSTFCADNAQNRAEFEAYKAWLNNPRRHSTPSAKNKKQYLTPEQHSNLKAIGYDHCALHLKGERK